MKLQDKIKKFQNSYEELNHQYLPIKSDLLELNYKRMKCNLNEFEDEKTSLQGELNKRKSQLGNLSSLWEEKNNENQQLKDHYESLQLKIKQNSQSI